MVLVLVLLLPSWIVQPAANVPLRSAAALSASDKPQIPTAVSTALILPTLPPIILNNADWKPVEQDFNGVPMMQVPAGCFDMGSEQVADDEKPVTKICFDNSFWIDKTEVTNAQFARFGGHAAQSSHWTDADRPRETITWFEACDFCALRDAHLPTEAEWEYVARGPDDLSYPWGNDFAVYDVVHNVSQIAEVGSKPKGASWVGAMDMSGNVWEWVSTLYNPYPYPAPNSAEEQNSWVAIDDRATNRVMRGGSWSDVSSDYLRASNRLWFTPDFQNTDLGFRCARSD